MRIACLILIGALAACVPAQDRPPPAEAPQALLIEPASGAPGTEVTLRARGLPASTQVGVGYGPPYSEFDIVKQARTNEAGELTTTVRVPDHLASGSRLVFAASVTGTEIKRLSEAFIVK